ncbi:MAG: response regulator [Cyanobacteria bacterium P01_D01_bin.1]
MSENEKILVVDDTPANLEVISESLAAQNYKVATALSGDRALRRLQNYLPNLILLDVQMPGIDGFETCRQIKANPATASIPIIFITALSDTESIVKGFSLGAADYINKPFREPELLARVKTHLEMQRLTQNLEAQVIERTAKWQAALEALQQSKLQLIQSEKMSALGNLVAGVAHEINNPIGFLNGSISNAQEYLQDLFQHLKVYQQVYPNPDKAVEESAEEIDLDYLYHDFPKLLGSTTGALERIKSISTSLRTFSRADTEHKISADLHEGLDSTLLILKYRLKANEHRPAIDIVKDYSGLPKIECFPGQLNQVFMNLLANAIDVFDEAAQHSSFKALKEKPQVIRVKTMLCAELFNQSSVQSLNQLANQPSGQLAHYNAVAIGICDNGKGMTDDVKNRIFDHLFTTKAVGKGTGLGLAIAQQIVVDTHGGTLSVESEVGQGTEFWIRLPLAVPVSISAQTPMEMSIPGV